MERSIRSTIHPIQSSLSEGSFMKPLSVEVLPIWERSEKTANNLNNLNNFVSLYPIESFLIYNRGIDVFYNSSHTIVLDPIAPSSSVPHLKSFKLAKLPKILPITSKTSWVCVRSVSFLIWNGALDVLYNSSQTIVSI